MSNSPQGRSYVVRCCRGLFPPVPFAGLDTAPVCGIAQAESLRQHAATVAERMSNCRERSKLRLFAYAFIPRKVLVYYPFLVYDYQPCLEKVQPDQAIRNATITCDPLLNMTAAL